MPTEIYNVSDTLNNTVAQDQLMYQIGKDSAILKSAIRSEVNFDPNGLKIDFDVALDPAEKTALDTLVANHDGLGLSNQIQLFNPNENAVPKEKIEDAIADAAAGALILLPIGVTMASQKMSIPDGVEVQGQGGRSILVPLFNDDDVVELGESSAIANVGLNYSSNAHALIRYSGTTSALVKDVIFTGGTASSLGIIMDGTGLLTATGVLHHTDDADRVIRFDSGFLQLSNMSVGSGDVTVVIEGLGGECAMDSVSLSNISNCSYGLVIGDSKVKCGSVDFSEADKSFCYRNKRGRFICRSGFGDGGTNSIEVDPAAYPYDPVGYFRFSGALNISNISAPIGWNLDLKTTLDTIPIL